MKTIFLIEKYHIDYVNGCGDCGQNDNVTVVEYFDKMQKATVAFIDIIPKAGVVMEQAFDDDEETAVAWNDYSLYAISGKIKLLLMTTAKDV
jgi:hypothetical protein